MTKVADESEYIRALSCEALMLSVEWDVVSLSPLAEKNVVLQSIGGKVKLTVSQSSYSKILALEDDIGACCIASIMHGIVPECPALVIRVRGSNIFVLPLPELALLNRSSERETVLRRLMRVSGGFYGLLLSQSATALSDAADVLPPRGHRRRPPPEWSGDAEGKVLSRLLRTDKDKLTESVERWALAMSARKATDRGVTDIGLLGAVGRYMSRERFLLIAAEAMLLALRYGMTSCRGVSLDERGDGFTLVISARGIRSDVPSVSAQISEHLLEVFGARTTLTRSPDGSRLEVDIPCNGGYYHEIRNSFNIPYLADVIEYVRGQLYDVL